MPDEYDDLLDNLPAPKKRHVPTTSHLDVLTSFAKDNGLTVGSTTGGHHNTNSRHYTGNALDVKGSGAFDDARVKTLSDAAQARGLLLRDERKRPAGQKVWGGPHVHVEYNGAGDEYDKLLDSHVGPQQGGDEYDRLLDGVTSGGQSQELQPTVTTALDRLTADVNERTARIKAPQISKQDAERPLYDAGQPSTVNQTSDELRVMKGEQPVDRQAYSRQQDAQTRLSQMRDESYRETQAREAKDAAWRTANQPEIDRQTELYKQDIRKSGGNADRWIAEFGSKAAGQLLEVLPGSTARIHSEAALRAAEDEGASRSQLSKGVQNIGAGFIGNAPELAAMALGAPPVATFAAGSAIRSKSSDPLEVAKAAGQGGAQGLAYEIPGVGEGLKRVVTGSAATGLGTAGVELASGASPKDAAISGVTNAIMRGAPEAVRLRTRGRVAEPSVERPTIPEGQQNELRSSFMREQVAPAANFPQIGSQPTDVQLRDRAGRIGRTQATLKGRVASPEIQDIPSPVITGEPEGAKLNRWQHRDFGLVTETSNQTRVSAGRVRVIDENGGEHVIQRPSGTGAGNQIAVPVRETARAREQREEREAKAPYRVIDKRAQAQPESTVRPQPTKPVDVPNVAPSPQVEAVAKPPSTVTLTPRQQGVRSFPETLESTGREGGTDRNYDVFTDKDSRERADKRIAENPQAAHDYVMQGNAAPETESGKERIITGLKLADQLSTEAESSTDPVDAAEKHAKASELYTKLSVDLTSAGQTVQAASQARKYSREGAALEVARIAKAKGETPKTEDVSAVREMAKRQDDLESRLATVQSQIESMKAQVKGEPRAKTSRSKLESLTDRLSRMETEARARLAARTGVKGSQAGASTIPLDIADYSIIGAAKIAKGGVNFATWSADMVSEFGDEVKPHLDKIFVASKKLRDEHAANLKEESTARGAMKAGKSIEDYRQERYELQTKKRLNARDMNRKFRELELHSQGGIKGAALKTDAIASTVLRDGLLSFHGLFNILSGMTAKQAVDTAARIPESALDIARVRGAQMLGKSVPRTSAGLSVRGLAESARYLAKEGPRNVGKSMAGKPSEVMPETFKGPFDNPYANAAIGPMGKLYGAKEALIRSWAYPTERQNQARVLARNDAMDGVIKRGEYNKRVNDYLNGRAEVEGARNKALVKSLAENAADYEIKNHDTIPSAKTMRVKELTNNPSQLIDAVASQYADRQVYAEPLGERLQKLQRGLKGGLGKTGESIVLPFLKRPANSIKDLLYTYTGARVPVEAIRNSFGRGWGPAEIKSMNQAAARGGAGPALFALGFALAAKGMLTSQNDKAHPGSLVVNGKYYAISRVPVIGWLLTAGAVAKIDGPRHVPAAMAKMILEHPLMRAVKTVGEFGDSALAALKGETGRAKAEASSAAGKMVGRVIPTPLAAAAETADGQNRDTRGLLGPLKARIPVVRESLPAQGQKERGSAFDPFLGYPARQSSRKRGALKF